MKKDLRGRHWKKIPKEKRTKIMSKLAKKLWEDKTPEERSQWSRNMNEKRWG